MRVVVADPPAYTPPYDRSLCAALARAGADVELVTSRFRFGAVAEPAGYEVHDWFYPLSSRMNGTRLRLGVKALEHPLGMARFALARPDVLHVQWLGAPELDRWLFRPRSPAVLTAHDIIPRRTLKKTAMWRALFERFERVVVHSERGRGQLADFGVPNEKLCVIGHPVFRSDVDRRDDGRTALCLGLIRPYKGTEDAVEAVLRVDDARLLVVGDPRVPLGGLMATAGDRAEWRLGYLPDAELRHALSEATVGLFPYREEIDLSGALL
jgi:glycosyltransferase involved in cell wall biosynthesis